MKFSKLSLAVAILACGAYVASAADSLGEAFGNGNLGAKSRLRMPIKPTKIVRIATNTFWLRASS